MDIFNTKYEEFATKLKEVCPELAPLIAGAMVLPADLRKSQFKELVLPSCSPKRDMKINPKNVLPGVVLSKKIWSEMSETTRKAVQEYLTVMSFSFLLENGTSGDVPASGWTSEWAEKMMDEMKEKMGDFDFAGITEKFAEIFTSEGGFPKLPEKFLKGQIARLAEDIVKEFDVTELGLDPAAMEAAGNDPSKALKMITDILMRIIQKLTKKIQKKIQSGAIRPQELAAEAEELMKTFSENPQFVSLMESFRKSFGAAGEGRAEHPNDRNSSSRMDIVRERLRKKLEAKKNGK